MSCARMKVFNPEEFAKHTQGEKQKETQQMNNQMEAEEASK